MHPSSYVAFRRGRFTQPTLQEKEDSIQPAPHSPWLIPPPASAAIVSPRRIRVKMVKHAHEPAISWLSHRGIFTRCSAFLGGLLAVCVVLILLGTEEANWSPTFRDSTLVFCREELQRIWRWEIDSGHHPSSAKIPELIGFTTRILNPAFPPARAHTLISPFTPPSAPIITTARGVGPQRTYHIVQSLSQDPDAISYPPRPIRGSVADLDIIRDRCHFANGKFVRDCLEFLRTGAGLDNGRRIRRRNLDKQRYIYTEERSNAGEQYFEHTISPLLPATLPTGRYDPNTGLQKKRRSSWEPPLILSPSQGSSQHNSAVPHIPEHPRLFHMYWAGPFDDKPYATLLSFLFTQNLGLHLENTSESVYYPRIWVWINPHPAAAPPTVSALTEIYQSLKTNPWAAPFLHPRFKDIIKFKLWNTTEQLDSIPELRDEWRSINTLFNSGGVSVSIPRHNSLLGSGNGIANRVGSKSAASYDRLSVILSDIARFIVTHRFGGIYIDADTIFLRDWEELWGWKGAFAYRWSYHDFHNTAVLHLNKGSALGSFLFRTALRNGFDFHPSSITRYLKDAHLLPLLTQLPDALFDPAWLNTEGLQQERPPQPFFTAFSDFFNTPLHQSAAPLATGFDGFFKGAFSYHFHNSWWLPFDPARHWPDLGSRFAEGERAARAAADPDADPDGLGDEMEDDKVDLDWATVLKRTFESYIRGERPNMYGEWLRWQ